MQQSKISTQPMNTLKNSGTTTPTTTKQRKKSSKKYYKMKTVLHFSQYGVKLLDHAKKLAKERGCKAITLDSGLPRVQAHGFYEHYGFEKSCYGFELVL